jgi:hypothetical protein
VTSQTWVVIIIAVKLMHMDMVTCEHFRLPSSKLNLKAQVMFKEVVCLLVLTEFS